MSHIVIDARIINSSTGTYVERLLFYLQKIDTTNTYTVLVLEKDKYFWKPINKNFNVIIADFKNYSLSEQIGFKKLLDKLSPDLVHFCMPQQPIFFNGKHVTTFHDLTLLKTYNSDKNWLIFHLKQIIGRVVFKKILKNSNHIISPTEFTKNELLNFSKIQPDKITVTYEAADVFIDKLEPYNHSFNQYILYVGKQSDYKNIRKLGDAHQNLQKKFPNLGLILTGKIDSSTEKNRNYFIKNNYKNIIFTDFIPNSQRDWLYTNTAAYIFPSLMEGFGLPGLEAMGYGAPVISSNTTCLPEVYGDAAYYFNPTNTKDISEAISKVLSDNILRNNLIKKGYKKNKEYSWERMASQTHKIYLDSINNN